MSKFKVGDHVIGRWGSGVLIYVNPSPSGFSFIHRDDGAGWKAQDLHLSSYPFLHGKDNLWGVYIAECELSIPDIDDGYEVDCG